MNLKGQTIIEVMVALAVGIIILSAVTTAVLTSLNNVEQSSSQDQSSNYATDGLEIVRKVRDTQLATFKNLDGTYCLATSCTSILTQPDTSCGQKVADCEESERGFIREVTIQKNASSCRLTPAPTDVSLNGAQVTVKVMWRDSKCTDPDNPYCHDTSMQSCLFPTLVQ